MTQYNNQVDQGRELGWDDEIEKDSEFALLAPGDYNFKVTSFERARYTPGPDAKLPPCNQVTVFIEVTGTDSITGKQATVSVKYLLFLHTQTEGMLSAFFAGIGQKKHGEKLKMNWNTVVGSTGKLTLGHQEYNGNTYHKIKKFFPKEEQVPVGNYTPGSF